MRLLDRYLLSLFVPIVLVSLLLFVMLIQLIELFSDLARYIELQVSFVEIMATQRYYLPRSIAFALPIAVLFGSSFTLGSLYSSNEMIAIFGAGVPLHRFVVSLLCCGILASGGLFLLEETVVIDSLRTHKELKQQLLSINRSFNNNNVAAFDANGRHVYYADLYHHGSASLEGVIIIERDPRGGVIQRIDADSAVWIDDHWRLMEITIYRWDGATERLSSETMSMADAPALTLSPDTFQRSYNEIEDFRLLDAKEYIESLQVKGLPHREELTDYYERFSFALTPFIVIFISSSISGHFRKNILLMSLLGALCFSVVYYVIGLMTDVLASTGRIDPLFAAWFGFVLYSMLGVLLFIRSKS